MKWQKNLTTENEKTAAIAASLLLSSGVKADDAALQDQLMSSLNSFGKKYLPANGNEVMQHAIKSRIDMLCRMAPRIAGNTDWNGVLSDVMVSDSILATDIPLFI